MWQGRRVSGRAALPVDVVRDAPVVQVCGVWGSVGGVIIWGAPVGLQVQQLGSGQGITFKDARADQLKSIDGRHGTRWQVSRPVACATDCDPLAGFNVSAP